MLALDPPFGHLVLAFTVTSFELFGIHPTCPALSLTRSQAFCLATMLRTVPILAVATTDELELACARMSTFARIVAVRSVTVVVTLPVAVAATDAVVPVLAVDAAMLAADLENSLM
jgi:hypothetical protein